MAHGNEDYISKFYMILVEFFQISVESQYLESLNNQYNTPTSIRFEFWDHRGEKTLVCSIPQLGNDFESFNSISVLFPIDYNTITKLYQNPDYFELFVKVVVEKQLPHRNIDLIGEAFLNLYKLYSKILPEILNCEGISKCMEETKANIYLSKYMANMGKVHYSMRISGCGHTIVTNLTAPIPQYPEMFAFRKTVRKNGDDDELYEFRKVNPHDVSQNPNNNPHNPDDFFQNFSKNLHNSVTCSMCLHRALYCKHCEKVAVAEEREKIIDTRMDTEIEKTSEYMVSESSLQSSHVSTKPIVLKVSGLFDNADGEKPTVTVADESTAANSNSLYPDYDVFVLRIGKKGLVGVGEKSDIQLEMKTPKGPERRPPIRYETREMQTDVTEEEIKDRKKKQKKKEKKK